MAKTTTNNTTDNTDTAASPAAPAREATVLVRVIRTGTLIYGAYGRAGATARVTASEAVALEDAHLAERIGI